MKAFFAAITPKEGKLVGLSPNVDTLPLTFVPAEQYAIRCSQELFDEACGLLARDKGDQALRLLKRGCHSFTQVG